MASRAAAHAFAREDAPRARAPELRFAANDWRALDNPVQIGRWDALAHWAAEPNPFHESWYLLPALRALDPQGEVQLLCLEADGELAGLLPLCRETDHNGRWLPHWRLWRHPDSFVGAPLVARGCEGVFWRALLDWANKHAGTRLFLHLEHLPRDGALLTSLERALAYEGREAVTASEPAPRAAQAQACEAVQGALAENGELAIERANGTEDLALWTALFLALERAARKGEPPADAAANEALFRETLAGAAPRGKLERLSLTLDGRAIAMQATFVSLPGAFVYKTVESEAFAAYSPAALLRRETLTLLERDDIEWCERRESMRTDIAIGGPLRRALFRALA
jgi:hypothetical protein